MINRDKLPDNSTELKGVVCHLLDMVEEQRRLIANQNERLDAQFQKLEEQSQQLANQSQRIDQLTDQVNALKRHRFGKKSEKLPDEEPPEESGSGGDSGPSTSSPDAYGMRASTTLVSSNLAATIKAFHKEKEGIHLPHFETSTTKMV